MSLWECTVSQPQPLDLEASLLVLGYTPSLLESRPLARRALLEASLLVLGAPTIRDRRVWLAEKLEEHFD